MMKWMVKQVNQKNKGFTLIEMVVVLAIIAVLIAIAVPQVMKQINKAKINADIANAKAIATAIQQWVADGNTVSSLSNTEKPVSDLTWINSYITGGVPKVKYNSTWKFYYKYETLSDTVYISAGDGTNYNVIYPQPTGTNNPYNQ